MEDFDIKKVEGREGRGQNHPWLNCYQSMSQEFSFRDRRDDNSAPTGFSRRGKDENEKMLKKWSWGL